MLIPENDEPGAEILDSCYTRRFMFRNGFISGKADLLSDYAVGTSVSHDDRTYLALANLNAKPGALKRYTLTDTPGNYVDSIKKVMAQSHDL